MLFLRTWAWTHASASWAAVQPFLSAKALSLSTSTMFCRHTWTSMAFHAMGGLLRTRWLYLQQSHFQSDLDYVQWQALQELFGSSR